MRKILFVTAAMAALSFGPAAAQEMSGKDMSKMASDAAFSIPEACEPAAQAGAMAGMPDMSGMKHEGEGSKKEMSCMKDGKCTMMGGMDMTGGDAAEMPGMDDAQKESMAGMMKMHGPMMAAHMIKDPNLAFTCGMLAHHMGAIEMSKVELKYGKDADARAMATKIIAAQEAEIVEMTAWIEKNAKK